MNPIARYRQALGGLDDAADQLRRAELARVSQLAARRPALDAAAAKAQRQVRDTEEHMQGMWRAAQLLLAPELWAALGPYPQPDPAAAPADLPTLGAMAPARLADLRRAVRRWWRPR